jgi:L-threonylcarbamoyladenylate synthase
MGNSMAKIISTHTPELFKAAVEQAASLLKSGEIVALPTETVYGLAANALDANAVARIYEVKGRPAHNPIIVHVSSRDMAAQCVHEWPELAERLALAFWPGPLTLVIPRSGQVPDIVTAGGSTVGVRWPNHPFIQAVIAACGFPLAAPSANPSNEISPTNAQHVAQKLGSKIPLIVDGGQSQVGIESTVLDLSSGPPRILRPGIIHEESLLAVLGPGNLRKNTEDTSSGPLRSPGLLRKHYAPKARVLILEWTSEAELARQLAAESFSPSDAHVIAHTHIPLSPNFCRVCVIPHDPEAYARAIYSELHRCDEVAARLIVLEKLPDAPEWEGVADRLKRASAASE